MEDILSFHLDVSIFMFRQLFFRYGESERRKIEENEVKKQVKKEKSDTHYSPKSECWRLKQIKLANKTLCNPNEECH
jgi:hypothetical protein